MTRWVVPGRNRETDLVVELGRRRDVAFLLDVKSHAGGPDQDAATLKKEGLGDNYLGGHCSLVRRGKPLLLHWTSCSDWFLAN